ncbi:MAG: type II toxin-antitoxin system HicB family antitoxin [Spirochaetia bacterium]|nr:type II toxin-antitoxin system HicB family antitoxin [Spirochaetia bacterium]
MKIDDYLKLPYTLELKKEEDGSYFIAVKELEGCFSVGDTAEKALTMIEDAKRAWIEFSLEKGLPIPKPEDPASKSYSGRFVVRVTPSLHRKLSLQAKANRVSLNYLVSEILSGKCAVIETQERVIDSFVEAYAKNSHDHTQNEKQE